MNVWAVPAVMVCSMCGATVASAQDDEPSAAELARAKQLYINGRELFSEEKYREAVDAWREGYRLSRKPAFLHNMGLAYEQMGFIEEAIDTLTRYRAFARADEVEELKQHIKALEERQESIDAGNGDPGGLGIDRPKAGIEMLDDDFDVQQRTDDRLDEPRPPRDAEPLPTAQLALMGGGGAAVVTGLVIGNSALAAKRAAAESCSNVGERYLCTEDAQAPLSRGRSLSVVADALVIGGLAAAGTGAWLTVGNQEASVAVSPRGMVLHCDF